ncbi:unnamed protein product [Periconia digitata]|uniref:Uncharacterized protein n=1 Tax=Periconia digitata TaxID=1303443 RepID=A0A9W4UFP8_9PLEO|nr:unnamed protein product [Periconia digitata]
MGRRSVWCCCRPYHRVGGVLAGTKPKAPSPIPRAAIVDTLVCDRYEDETLLFHMSNQDGPQQHVVSQPRSPLCRRRWSLCCLTLADPP